MLCYATICHHILSLGPLALWDIEDLVELGHSTRGCPYFASRSIAENAQLIFCPYNYIIDPGEKMRCDVM